MLLAMCQAVAILSLKQSMAAMNAPTYLKQASGLISHALGHIEGTQQSLDLKCFLIFSLFQWFYEKYKSRFPADFVI